jgi:hypothetical protein
MLVPRAWAAARSRSPSAGPGQARDVQDRRSDVDSPRDRGARADRSPWRRTGSWPGTTVMLTLVIERRADQRRIVSGYNTIVAAHPAPRQLGSRFQSKARTCPEEGHDAGDRRSHKSWRTRRSRRSGHSRRRADPFAQRRAAALCSPGRRTHPHSHTQRPSRPRQVRRLSARCARSRCSSWGHGTFTAAVICPLVQFRSRPTARRHATRHSPGMN